MVKIRLTEQGWELRERVKDIPAQLGNCISLSREDAYRLYQLLYGLLDGKEK